MTRRERLDAALIALFMPVSRRLETGMGISPYLAARMCLSVALVCSSTHLLSQFFTDDALLHSIENEGQALVCSLVFYIICFALDKEYKCKDVIRKHIGNSQTMGCSEHSLSTSLGCVLLLVVTFVVSIPLFMGLFTDMQDVRLLPVLFLGLTASTYFAVCGDRTLPPPRVAKQIKQKRYKFAGGFALS